jgi:hypothetical protein
MSAQVGGARPYFPTTRLHALATLDMTLAVS